MLVLLFVILLLGTPGFAIAEPDPPPGIKILLPGEFHPKEVDADSGEVWLVLYKRNGEYRTELRPIRIEACRDMGDSPGQMTGKRVASDVDGEVSLFVEGLRGIPTGPVRTAFDSSLCLYPGQNRSFQLPDGEWTFLAALGRAVEYDRGEEGIARCIADYKIAFSRSPSELRWQNLDLPIMECGSGPPTIEWAGDLDGDQHSDLLILRRGDNYAEWILYLSSMAQLPNQIRRVASRVHVGC